MTQADEKKNCPIFLAAQISRLGVGNDNAPESFFCDSHCAWYDEETLTCGILAALRGIPQTKSGTQQHKRAYSVRNPLLFKAF